MNKLQRIGRAIGSILRSSNPFSDEAWESLHQSGNRTVAGINITPDNALTITAVFAAINRISTDTACLPLLCYKRRKDGGRDEVRDTAHYEVLNVSPDGERVAMRFRQTLMANVLGHGNGCAEIETTQGGKLYRLHLLDATTKAERDQSTGSLFYRTTNGRELKAPQVLHVAGLGGDGINGYSPIRQAREACAISKATEQFGASFFGNGTRPGGWVKLPANFKPDAMDNLRKSLEAVHKGSASAHKIGFLEPGMEFTATTVDPEEAQFLATRQFQILEVARMFNIPPNKLMDYSNAHLSNIEESNLDYLSTTLMSWCEQAEQAMNFRLFTPQERAAGFYVEHNMAAFLRGNMAARAEYFTKMRDLGVVSVNEIRRLENMDPLGSEGDIRLVPLNMTSLENAGKPLPAPPQSQTSRN